MKPPRLDPTQESTALIQMALEFALVYALVLVLERKEHPFIRVTIAVAMTAIPRIMYFLAATAITLLSLPTWTQLLVLPVFFVVPIAILRVYVKYTWKRCVLYGVVVTLVVLLSDVAAYQLFGNS